MHIFHVSSIKARVLESMRNGLTSVNGGKPNIFRVDPMIELHEAVTGSEKLGQTVSVTHTFNHHSTWLYTYVLEPFQRILRDRPTFLEALDLKNKALCKALENHDPDNFNETPNGFKLPNFKFTYANLTRIRELYDYQLEILTKEHRAFFKNQV